MKAIFNNVHSTGEYTVINNIELTNANYLTGEVGLQYYPIVGKNLRFHVVGSYSSDNKDEFHAINGNSDVLNSRSHYTNQVQIMAGVRIGFDFRKGINNL